MIVFSDKDEPSSPKDSDKKEPIANDVTNSPGFCSTNAALATQRKMGPGYGVFTEKNGKSQVLKLQDDLMFSRNKPSSFSLNFPLYPHVSLRRSIPVQVSSCSPTQPPTGHYIFIFL
jgi:hypothetical protein